MQTQKCAVKIIPAALLCVLTTTIAMPCGQSTVVVNNIPTLGGLFFRGQGLGAGGQVIGVSATAGPNSDAFVYANGNITDLGNFGGTHSQANAINAAGMIAGDANLTGNSATHAFLYNAGTPGDLGTLGGTYSSATALNNAGVVAGSSTTSSGDTHAFSYSGGTMTDLGVIGGGSYSAANAINSAGVIVGDAGEADGSTHAFAYSGGVMSDLGVLGGTGSSARGINDSGTISGEYVGQDGNLHGFIVTNGVMADIGDLGGGSATVGQGNFTTAGSINSSGQIVGNSLVPDENTHGFIYKNGAITDLGSLGGDVSFAEAQNNNGQVVGYSLLGDGSTTHAFLWQGGAMTDLNSLVTDPSWVLMTAEFINDAGNIVGEGTQNGVFTWYEMSLVSSGPPPIAIATPTQTTLECPGEVTLDGSGSSDPSGAPITYQWIEGAQVLGTNVALHAYFGFGLHNVSLVVTDPCGNSGTNTVTVLVADTVAPVITQAPGPISVESGTNCDVTVPDLTHRISATDNCTAARKLVITQNPPAGTIVGIGSYMIAMTVTDASGNSTTTNIIYTVRDTRKPVIVSAPASVTVSAGANGQATVPDLTSQIVASDSCTPANQLVITQSIPAGTLEGVGHYSITVTVTDAYGNSVQRCILLKVVDTTPPVIVSIPASVTESANQNGRAAVPNFAAEVVATDNCTPTAELKITQSPLAGEMVTGLGQHAVTITVRDAAGNITTGVAQFTVVDTTAPVIKQVKATPGSLIAATNEVMAVTVTVVAQDNCDPAPAAKIVSVTCNESTKPGDIAITGNLTVNLAATETSKNGSRIYTITVQSTDASGNTSLPATTTVRVSKN